MSVKGRKENPNEGLPRNPYLRYGDGRYIHRVIWESKHGPIPKGMVIHHKNHNKRDNRLRNLEMVPKSEHIPNFHNGEGRRY